MKIKLITTIFFISYFCLSATISSGQDIDFQTKKFKRVLYLLENFYVDSVDLNQLVETAITQMLAQLDPHTIYINVEDAAAMNESLLGSFVGIGIKYRYFRDTMLIVNLVPQGPAEKAGLMTGDRVIKIDTNLVTGVKLKDSQIRDMIRGQAGSNVVLEVKRRPKNKPIDINITRDKIPINSIDAAYSINNEVGYLRLNKFSATSAEEFNAAMGKLILSGMKHLILDLRDNPGGYLNVAVELCDQFLDQERLIVYTEGVNSPRASFFATEKNDFNIDRIVVLIDENSASASEIVSGAIQDWDRGLILGRRSFGKGLVQKPFNLQDESTVRITSARYYTPTGRLIQKDYNNGIENYRSEVNHRLQTGELFFADTCQIPDSLQYKTLLNNRNVYGGGGITPDIFIPIDTAVLTTLYRDLINNDILYEFVLDYLDCNRIELKNKYTDFQLFRKNFDFSESVKTEFQNYAEKKLTELKQAETMPANPEITNGNSNNNDEEEDNDDSSQYNFIECATYAEAFNISKNQIFLLMKAVIARDLWNNNEYYYVLNKTDNALQTATEIITNAGLYEKILSNNPEH